MQQIVEGAGFAAGIGTGGLLFISKKGGKAVIKKVTNEVTKDVITGASGQIHHILSNKIMNALNNHKTLKGIFKRSDFTVQAINKQAHLGYEEWHRCYDQRVVEWLKNNRNAKPKQFLQFLQEIHQEPWLKNRFPIF